MCHFHFTSKWMSTSLSIKMLEYSSRENALLKKCMSCGRMSRHAVSAHPLQFSEVTRCWSRCGFRAVPFEINLLGHVMDILSPVGFPWLQNVAKSKWMLDSSVSNYRYLISIMLRYQLVNAPAMFYTHVVLTLWLRYWDSPLPWQWPCGWSRMLSAWLQRCAVLGFFCPDHRALVLLCIFWSLAFTALIGSTTGLKQICVCALPSIHLHMLKHNFNQTHTQTKNKKTKQTYICI